MTSHLKASLNYCPLKEATGFIAKLAKFVRSYSCDFPYLLISLEPHTDKHFKHSSRINVVQTRFWKLQREDMSVFSTPNPVLNTIFNKVCIAFLVNFQDLDYINNLSWFCNQTKVMSTTKLFSYIATNVYLLQQNVRLLQQYFLLR